LFSAVFFFLKKGNINNTEKKNHTQPQKWLDDFVKAGCDLYCFHYEAAAASGEPTTDPIGKVAQLVKNVHEKGIRAGVAIKPDTPVEVLFPLLDVENVADRPDVCFSLSFFSFLSIPCPPCPLIQVANTWDR
jgi:hypothetical protein